MKAFLMYRERDFDLKRALPWNAQALTQDLALDTLFDAMALGDKFLREVVRVAVLSGVDDDLGVVLYRQDVLSPFSTVGSYFTNQIDTRYPR